MGLSRNHIALKIRHCGFTLTSRKSQTFRPLVSTFNVKYQGVRINLKSTFMNFTTHEFSCPGTCTGHVEAWQGHGFDGSKSKLQQIMPSEAEEWELIKAASEKVDDEGDIMAVQGSERFFPYRFKQIIPVYK